ncbi:MAG: UDP-N-acetylglucosamine 2-epimerase (non-hydrolyzing) [Anaerolineaceae bacterium]|nr:UDP-N-acetylglucosamine 2-epimerase (non-hydrolyzing) [Anaerolineaceae bacterium]
MKIISLVGARPQFIKAAMVSRALRPHCQEILVHTGQHYDGNMSQVFFDELELPEPDLFLGVGSGSHAVQTGRMMTGVEEILLKEKPDWLVVYGDTNTTLAGALAAAKLQTPIAHVEAGLRSFQRAMPEEINRVLVDHISTALFCPTQPAVDNLAREGISQGVHIVGDVMADALLHFIQLAPHKTTILADLKLEPGKYALATIHRAANTDDPLRLKAILRAFEEADLPVIFPVHPRTRKVIRDLGIFTNNNVHMIDPVGYLAMLQLEANADCILTDSGGVQKEAYWVGVRCITLRDETEWVETVELGWNKLTGADTASIVAAVRYWRPTTNRTPVYGNGHSAEKISAILLAQS